MSKYYDVRVVCHLRVDVEDGVVFNISSFGYSLADDFSTNEIGHTILDSIVEDYEVVGRVQNEKL